ncbi:hypothetical protein ACHAWF_001303 [Thalassiosira exigua]
MVQMEGVTHRKMVQMEGVTPIIFRMVLGYVYGEDAPDSVTAADAREIIIASNYYEVPGLKLAMEATLVKMMVVDMKNVADWLLFAQSKTCPLLQEYALQYCAIRAEDMNFDCMERDMSVNELRKHIHARGLDVDGSKQALLSLKMKSKKRQRTE